MSFIMLIWLWESEDINTAWQNSTALLLFWYTTSVLSIPSCWTVHGKTVVLWVPGQIQLIKTIEVSAYWITSPDIQKLITMTFSAKLVNGVYFGFCAYFISPKLEFTFLWSVYQPTHFLPLLCAVNIAFTNPVKSVNGFRNGEGKKNDLLLWFLSLLLLG